MHWNSLSPHPTPLGAYGASTSPPSPTLEPPLRTGVNVLSPVLIGRLYCAVVEVKIVKQMPAQAPGKKPTVAVITSRYYEKLAVDAMMEDKTTFVKYKTEGMINLRNRLCSWS